MKWYTYLICIVFCISGIFCGIGLYKDVKAESYVNGSINIKNKFSQTNFSYASTSVSFYHDLYDTTDTYYFKIDKLKVDNFNGETKKYQTKLNDYMLLDTEYSAGAVLANIDFDFYDTEGKVLHSAKLIVGVQYLSDKTTFTLSTKTNVSASYLTQYFAANGIRFEIREIFEKEIE